MRPQLHYQQRRSASDGGMQRMSTCGCSGRSGVRRSPCPVQALLSNSSSSSSGPSSGGNAPSFSGRSGPFSTSTRLRSVAVVETAASLSLDAHLGRLRDFHAAGEKVQEAQVEAALVAASIIKDTVAHAVNTKSAGLKTLQASVVSSGVIAPLLALAKREHPVAYEALQILCYRNTVTCKQLVTDGVVDMIAYSLTQSSVELQCAMCFLLTALAAFNESVHMEILGSGAVPILVALCRTKTNGMVETGQRLATLQTRSAAVLRNLAHNPKSHGLLIQSGAVDVLAGIMRTSADPSTRINAAVAVACLVGHEEGNPKLQLEEGLVGEMLEVLDASCQGSMMHGMFWTVWKLCQGLASLTVNDRNKELITSKGGIEILAEVLFGKHHNNEAAHRYALSALWNLAFNETSRNIIVETPGLVEAIRTTLATSESTKTKEVAKGALWTLGLEQDVKQLHENTIAHVVEEAKETTGLGGHIMLSYEWGCQQSVMLMKSELQAAGYATWMDIDKMSGSTLEAMARAVEESACVLVCVSKRYKESQACRTEAEYAFQQRKKIVPILMERDYKPSGWLGALIGTRLYFNMADSRSIPAKMPGLLKELGDAGKLDVAASPGVGDKGSARSSNNSSNNVAAKTTRDELPDGWTCAEVEEWLKRIKCGELAAAFRSQDMDGVALSGLYRAAADIRFVHETLRSEFGMESLGQRLRVIEELHRLFA